MVSMRLTPADDLMLHQTLDPASRMWTTDVRAYERFWFGLQDDAGQVRVTQGTAFYPNLGRSEAFAIVVHEGMHTTVRAYQEYSGDRADLNFPPLSARIVEGLSRWDIALAANQWSIDYELTWQDTKRPEFRRIGPIENHDGVITKAMAGFETFGRATGSIRVGEHTFDAAAVGLRGSRDRHWGIRNGVGGRAHWVGDPTRSSLPPYFPGQWVEFENFAVWGDVVLRNPDDERPAERIVGFERRLRFDPATHLFRSGTVVNHLDGGGTLTLEFERLGNQIAFLRCAGYGGPRGGTPGGDVWAGTFDGPNTVEAETFDLNDPDVQVRLAGLDQHHCVVTCDGEVTQGLFEGYEPELYERCSAGEPTFELVV